MRGSNAANADAELALLLAGTGRRRQHARARIAELAAAAHPRRLVAYLDERRLLALLGSRLLDVLPEPPATLRDAVAAAIDRNRLEAMAIDGATTRLARRLEDQGIAALPLKGPRLAQALYGDTGMRASADVDILVPAESLERAVTLARAEGYGAPTEDVGPGELPELHFEMPHPRLPTLELHWRVHWYESGFSQAALRRSGPAEDGLRRAQPADELAMLLLFYARDGFHGLRHAADIAAWWDGRTTPSGPTAGLLDEHAARYTDMARALRAAAACAALHAGVPAAALLSGTRRLDRGERLAVALADWATEDDRDQLAANIALVDGLLSPRGAALKFTRRQLWPPAWDLLPRGEPAPHGPALGLRASHAAKTLARFGLALGRIRSGQPWRPLPPAACDHEPAPAPEV